MNVLANRLRDRRDELVARGESMRKRAELAGWAGPSTVYAHLRTYDPYRQSIRADVLDKLAIAFDLDREEIANLAMQATMPEDGNALQLLIRAHMASNDLSLRDVAASTGVGLTTLHSIAKGDHTNITDAVAKKIAKGTRIPVKTIIDAANRAAKRDTYRLPDHITENLTPEQWKKIVKIIEATVSFDEDE